MGKKTQARTRRGERVRIRRPGLRRRGASEAAGAAMNGAASVPASDTSAADHDVGDGTSSFEAASMPEFDTDSAAAEQSAEDGSSVRLAKLASTSRAPTVEDDSVSHSPALHRRPGIW